jgi:hypothetical protein
MPYGALYAATKPPMWIITNVRIAQAGLPLQQELDGKYQAFSPAAAC